MIDIIKIAKKLSENPKDTTYNIDNSLCLRRHKFSRCQNCARHCPQNIIKFSETNLISFEKDKCVACGICESVCPTKAFSSSPSIIYSIAQNLKRDVATVICCAKSEQKDSLTLSCLGALSEAILLLCALKTRSCLLVIDKCNSCNYAGEALPLIKDRVRKANNLLKIIGSDKKINVTEKPLVKENIIDRQEFIKEMTKELTDISLSSINTNDELSNQQTIESSLLQSFLKNTEIKTKSELELPFYQIEISDDCDFCLKCTRFCPTKAIEESVTAKNTSISLSIQNCNGCNLCRDICQKKCLDIHSKIETSKLNKMIVLIKKKVKLCLDCSRPLTEKEIPQNICNRCSQKKSLSNNIKSVFE